MKRGVNTNYALYHLSTTYVYTIMENRDTLFHRTTYDIKQIIKHAPGKHFLVRHNVLIREFESENGMLNGIYRSYGKDGSLEYEGGYSSGKKCGFWLYYDSDGDLIRKEFCNDECE